MSLYRFGIDAPAAPEVVAARLRSATVGSADSRSPFAGPVQDLAFKLHRNAGSRSTLTPRIWGRIVSTPNGSRVNIVMFTHPGFLILMLLWIEMLGYLAWSTSDQRTNLYYASITGIVVALVGAIGGFFSEVLRTLPLLSATILTPTAELPPPPIPQSYAEPNTPRPRPARAPGLLGLGAVILGLFQVIVVGYYEFRLRACPAFAASLDLLKDTPAAAALLGSPIQSGLFIRGVVHQAPEAGYALLSIPVRGMKAAGTLHVVANRMQNRWSLTRVALWTDGAARLDLTPTVQSETFRYPAPGAVYLLPLDQPSATALKELPAYYAARHGISVKILPMSPLSLEILDAGNQQVVAEKAIESIATIPEIAEDFNASIVAVTGQDLFIKSDAWPSATNYRQGRFAIISTSRLSSMPWYAGANPEAFAARLRKVITKNVLLLHYGFSLSADPTSVISFSASTISQLDGMSESLFGELRNWSPAPTDAPCIAIIQGPGNRQAWRQGCSEDPPLDSRFETFQNYTQVPLLVATHTDFAFGGQPSLYFVRKYRPADDRSRSFGIGANDSFDIFPSGDSQTFSYLNLVREDGQNIHYKRTSRGTSYTDARFQAPSYGGNPFSQSLLWWNGNGWDLSTIDGVTYTFPSSGPDRTPQQSALIRVATRSGSVVTIQRNADGALQRAQAADGSWIAFTCDPKLRVTLARHSTGQEVRYEYDAGGRLVHIQDSTRGEAFYRYDPLNRLTSVLDSGGRTLLANTYGYVGEVTSQTLADGRTLRYEYGFDGKGDPTFVKFIDDRGYVTQWMLGRGGFFPSLPQARNP